MNYANLCASATVTASPGSSDISGVTDMLFPTAYNCDALTPECAKVAFDPSEGAAWVTLSTPNCS